MKLTANGPNPEFVDSFTVTGPLSQFIGMEVSGLALNRDIRVVIEKIDPETNTIWLAPAKTEKAQ